MEKIVLVIIMQTTFIHGSATLLSRCSGESCSFFMCWIKIYDNSRWNDFWLITMKILAIKDEQVLLEKFLHFSLFQFSVLRELKRFYQESIAISLM